ncbi:phage holin [Caproiciproducens sp. MSJ-32]|uniref:phage holin n=1 Tax=Caproiciproducens sp. MSJ-32 TaxID=2841527 RepID=UPI001C0F4046|nr:phage holin [Caproiciproducens sp. MSJ-32]MBU5454407.1 holin [Caproiciproducens sp. MSJ-32]
MKIDTSRFKNYGFWVSIFALIPMVLKALGMEIIPEQYETITTAILTILVALGILNNPTTECKWYRDDLKTIESENKKA